MSRLRSLLPLAAFGFAVLLGGCVAYPAYPGYGYGYAAPEYGYAAPAYYGGGWRR
jgi:hypothetical protein